MERAPPLNVTCILNDPLMDINVPLGKHMCRIFVKSKRIIKGAQFIPTPHCPTSLAFQILVRLTTSNATRQKLQETMLVTRWVVKAHRLKTSDLDCMIIRIDIDPKICRGI